MKVAVRYYSRGGNTKLLADTIAASVNTKAISIDASNSVIDKTVDILFIGGALYAYGLDKKLKDYILTLDNTKIKKAVVFSTSWISKHSIDLIKKYLQAQNIPFESEYIYYKNKPTDEDLQEAGVLAKKFITKNHK